jgi:hypothetical protein
MGPDTAVKLWDVDPWRDAKRHACDSRDPGKRAGRAEPGHPEPGHPAASHPAASCADYDSARYHSRDLGTSNGTSGRATASAGRNTGTGNEIDHSG